MEAAAQRLAQPHESLDRRGPFSGRRPGAHHGAARLRKDVRVRARRSAPSAPHAPPPAGAWLPRRGNVGRSVRKAKAALKSTAPMKATPAAKPGLKRAAVVGYFGFSLLFAGHAWGGPGYWGNTTSKGLRPTMIVTGSPVGLGPPGIVLPALMAEPLMALPLIPPFEVGALMDTASFPVDESCAARAVTKSCCSTGPFICTPRSNPPVRKKRANSFSTTIPLRVSAAMMFIPRAVPSPSRPYERTITLRPENCFKPSAIERCCSSLNLLGATRASSLMRSRRSCSEIRFASAAARFASAIRASAVATFATASREAAFAEAIWASASFTRAFASDAFALAVAAPAFATAAWRRASAISPACVAPTRLEYIRIPLLDSNANAAKTMAAKESQMYHRLKNSSQPLSSKGNTFPIGAILFLFGIVIMAAGWILMGYTK